MEDVARRRVVNDDALADRATELGQVLFVFARTYGEDQNAWSTHTGHKRGKEAVRYLDIVALIVVATLAEQPVLDDAVDVEVIEHGVGILGQRRGKHDDFVDLAHRFQERCSGGKEKKKGGSVRLRAICHERRRRDAPSTPGRLIT